MRRFGPLAALAACAALAAAGARAGTLPFKTPSGSDVCETFLGPGPAFLECGVVNAELVPPPPRPSASACGGLDFAGDRIRLGPSGRPYGFCAGDPGVLAQTAGARILAYGSSTAAGPFRCTSARAGLTCRNRSGHGFVLDGSRWHAV
jgi:hypothetical protein